MTDCEKLLTFDTKQVRTDFATQFAFLSSVTAENYDEMKKDFSAFVPGYFTGDYAEFQRRFSITSELVSHQSSTTFAQSYLQRSLSPGAAQNYARCLVESSKKLVGAWISEVSDDMIVVSVRTGALGEDKVTVTVQPASLGVEPVTLSAGGVTALAFPYNPRKDFLLVLQAQSTKTNSQDATVLKYPKRRALELKRDPVEVRGYIEAGAGFNGNTAANAHWLDAELLAPDGVELDIGTLSEVSREKVWPLGGLKSFRLEVTEGRDAKGRLVRLRLHPTGIDGTHGDHQGNVRVHYVVRGYREYIVDHDAQAATPAQQGGRSIPEAVMGSLVTWSNSTTI